MLHKKTLFVLLLHVSTTFLTHTIDDQNQKIVLTMEDVEQLIKDIEKDPQLKKNMFLHIHSKEGLEKIIECINNFEECEHFGILGKNNPDHKKIRLLS
jgi:hypothetical protein